MPRQVDAYATRARGRAASWATWVTFHALLQCGGQGAGARGTRRPQWVTGVTGAVGIKSLAAYAIRYTITDYVTL